MNSNITRKAVAERQHVLRPLTPRPHSYTLSLLHHLPLIHRHTSHARCVKACLNRRNTIAYMSSPQIGGGQKKGIYKRFRFLWSHVKVMTLTLIFFNQSTTLKEIRLHRKFQVNPTFCSEDINDFGFQGHMSR